MSELGESIYFVVQVEAFTAEAAREMANILLDQFPPMLDCNVGPAGELEEGLWAVPVEVKW